MTGIKLFSDYQCSPFSWRDVPSPSTTGWSFYFRALLKDSESIQNNLHSSSDNKTSRESGSRYSTTWGSFLQQCFTLCLCHCDFCSHCGRYLCLRLTLLKVNDIFVVCLLFFINKYEPPEQIGWFILVQTDNFVQRFTFLNPTYPVWSKWIATLATDSILCSTLAELLVLLGPSQPFLLKQTDRKRDRQTVFHSFPPPHIHSRYSARTTV